MLWKNDELGKFRRYPWLLFGDGPSKIIDTERSESRLLEDRFREKRDLNARKCLSSGLLKISKALGTLKMKKAR